VDEIVDDGAADDSEVDSVVESGNDNVDDLVKSGVLLRNRNVVNFVGLVISCSTAVVLNVVVVEASVALNSSVVDTGRIGWLLSNVLLVLVLVGLAVVVGFVLTTTVEGGVGSASCSVVVRTIS
jgi:hypothetical protein